MTASLNATGQLSSSGSGTKLANTAARQRGRGLLAHQMCNVDKCPVWTYLSRTLSAEISLIGRATSMSFFIFYLDYVIFDLSRRKILLHRVETKIITPSWLAILREGGRTERPLFSARRPTSWQGH